MTACRRAFSLFASYIVAMTVASLGAFSYLQPLIRVQVTKAAIFGDAPPSEPVYQSFALPLASFVRATLPVSWPVKGRACEIIP